MSGGHFDYNQFRLTDISREIMSLINSNEVPNEFRQARKYPTDILDKFEVAMIILDTAADIVHHIDYLVEGDIGEDTFRELYNKAIKDFCTKLAEHQLT